MQEHIDACLDLEKNLPVELAFLIRQQAYCMARMNQLDRKIRKLQEASQVAQSQSKHHQNIDPTTTHVSSTSNALNQRLHGHHHHHHHYLQNQQQQLSQQTFNAQGQAIATTTKNGNFVLSDDSGGEYSRATISDDDELSSLLDQIAKSIRPEQARASNGSSSSVNMMISNNNNSQSMPPPHHIHQQSPLNQIQHRQHHMATANYGAFQGNQQQQQSQQQYAIINPSQMHPHSHHHHQALPIFVMGSPIVPVATHPSSISSSVLPGVHFQPEPRYNQYYEDFYCNGPSVAQANASVPPGMPLAATMMMPNRQQQQSFAATVAHSNLHQHNQHLQQLPSQLQQIHNLRASQQQHFESSMSAIEQIVTQKEKRQIMSQLKTADNWLKMRSSANTANGANNQRHNESSFISGSNNNNDNKNGNATNEASSSTTSSGSVMATASIVAPTAPRELTDLAQETLNSDKNTINTRLLPTATEQTTSGSPVAATTTTAAAISDGKR